MASNRVSDSIAELFEAARSAAGQAYAPYSKFTVGAALRLTTGEIVSGCNVENASYSVTLCAERVAAAAAVSNGKKDWTEIVVVSPTGVSPCGACRQFMAEFAPELKVYYGRLDGSAEDLIATDLQTLLPAQMRLLPESTSSE